jgi:putative ABC transport system substrate-binding protein
VKRREFIAGLAGAAAWPLAARAQQAAMPVVGFVHSGSAEAVRDNVVAFRKGLGETGYVEGRNLTVEYHYLEGNFHQLPSLVADLVRRRVAVIAVVGTPAARAAKAATATLPIVFAVGSDPVELGLVDSLSRPGGNITGVTTLEVALARAEAASAPARAGPCGGGRRRAGQPCQSIPRRADI